MDVSAEQIFEICRSDTAIADAQSKIVSPTNDLEHIPWMDAHLSFLSLFPDYHWEFLENDQGQEAFFYPDGTAEVRCRMTVGDRSIITSLPVHKRGKAIIKPSAFEINTAKQRCRVKAMAEFGWGAELWAKYENPEDSVPTATPVTRPEPDRATEEDREDQWISVAAITNQKDAHAAMKRYAKWCANVGLEDDSEERWDKLRASRKRTK